MSDPFTWVAIISTVASAGYSMYSNNEASKTAVHMGDIQAAEARMAALQEGRLAQANANAGFAAAESERQANEAVAAQVAANLKSALPAHDRAADEESRRLRERQMQQVAAQDAATSAGGLTMAGTPTAIALWQAQQHQFELMDNFTQREVERRQMLDQASIDIASAKQGARGAAMQGLNMVAERVQGGFQARMGNVTAGRIRDNAASTAAGYRADNVAQAISTAGSVANYGYQSRRKSPTNYGYGQVG